MEGNMKIRLFLRIGFCALVLCGCATNKDYSAQRNKEIVRRYFERWANHGDTAVADELIATNVTLRNPPAILHRLEDYKKGQVRTSIPGGRSAGWLSAGPLL